MTRLTRPDFSDYIDDQDPLESRAFYEYCQLYRHAQEWQEADRPKVGDAFEWLKSFIREHAEAILENNRA